MALKLSESERQFLLNFEKEHFVKKNKNYLSVKKIIFNNRATIVLWKDGTKTVVKCDPDDWFDHEKGIALCFMKKALGNKGSYNNIFKEYISWRK